jgi:hypothetical protein
MEQLEEKKQHKKRAKAVDLAKRAKQALQVQQGLLAAFRGSVAALRTPKFRCEMPLMLRARLRCHSRLGGSTTCRRKYGEYFLLMNGLVPLLSPTCGLCACAPSAHLVVLSVGPRRWAYSW